MTGVESTDGVVPVGGPLPPPTSLVRTMVFVVLGAKGGVGKTVFTEVLARTLAEVGSTVLVDGSTTNPNTDDHYRGLLERSPQRVRTLADDVVGPAQWWQHPTTQMLLVPGDRRPGNRRADTIRCQLDRTLRLARGVLDYVVIDAGHFADNGLVDWIVDQADRVVCVINHEPDSRSSIESWLVDHYIVHRRVTPAVFGVAYSPRSGQHPLQEHNAQLDVSAWNARVRAERSDLGATEIVEWLGSLPYSAELERLVLEGVLGESLVPYDVDSAVRAATSRLLRTDQLPPSLRQPPHGRVDGHGRPSLGLGDRIRRWFRPSRDDTGTIDVPSVPRPTPVAAPSPPAPLPAPTGPRLAPIEQVPVSNAERAVVAPHRLEFHVFGVPRLVGGTVSPGVARNILSYLAAFGPTPRQALARPCGFTPGSIRTHLSSLRTSGLIVTVDDLVMLPAELWVDLRELTTAQQQIVSGLADVALVEETLRLLGGIEGHVFESGSKRDRFGWREVDQSTLLFDVENLVVQTIDNLAGQWCDWSADERPPGEGLIDVFAHVQARMGFDDPWMIGQAMVAVVVEQPGLRPLFDDATSTWPAPPDHISQLLRRP